MKTERVTFLTTPQFKQFLEREAGKAGVSVGQLIRDRCGDQSDEQDAIRHLAKEVRDAIRTAGQRLDAVNEKVERTLAELKRNRKGRATRANAA
jgi:hypothetical protein